MFVNMNLYYTKHPSSRVHTHPLFQDSLIFAKTDYHWKQRRKCLQKLINKASDNLKETTLKVLGDALKRWVNRELEIDLLCEVQMLIARIMIEMSFGDGARNRKVVIKR